MADNVDTYDDRARKIAWLYVNRANGNKTHAYRLYKSSVDENFEPSNKDWTAAANCFKHKNIKKYVDEYYEENRALYDFQRDKNIQALNGIVEDPATPRKDRIAAVKELNNMFGYSSQNLNISGKTEIEVEIV